MAKRLDYGTPIPTYEVIVDIAHSDPGLIYRSLKGRLTVRVEALDDTEAATKAVVSLFRDLSPHPKMAIDVRKVTKK